MKTALKASLIEALDKWVVNSCDGAHWPTEGMAHGELVNHMADAAEAVFDATYTSSVYTETQV